MLTEVKTLPRGGLECTQTWYAQQCLGYSNFGFRCWSRDGGCKWFFLLGRVVEQSSQYLWACLERIRQLHPLPADSSERVCWSDGPSQMKNLRVLAYDATLCDKEPQLLRTERKHGSTQRIKGPWECEFGVSTSVVESFYKTLSNFYGGARPRGC